jgi:hypothetical protein
MYARCSRQHTMNPSLERPMIVSHRRSSMASDNKAATWLTIVLILCLWKFLDVVHDSSDATSTKTKDPKQRQSTRGYYNIYPASINILPLLISSFTRRLLSINAGWERVSDAKGTITGGTTRIARDRFPSDWNACAKRTRPFLRATSPKRGTGKAKIFTYTPFA